MYVVKNPTVKQHLMREIMDIKPSSGVVVTITHNSPNKTEAQRNYWHKLLEVLCRETGDSFDDRKDDIKCRVLGLIEKEDKNGIKRYCVPSSERLSSAKYADLITATIMIFQTMGFEYPSPDYYGLEIR